MLPVVALTALGGFDAVQRHDQASAAAKVEVQVKAVEQALDLDVALIPEDSASEFYVEAANFGLSPARATAILGLDSTARLESARASVDAALAADSDALAEEHEAGLSELRARIDSGLVADSDVRAFFTVRSAAANAAWRSEIAILGRMSSVTSGSVSVRQATTALKEAAVAFTAGSAETPASASLVLPGLPTAATARLDLAAASALYTSAASGLDADLGGEGRTAWRKLIVDDPDAQAFDSFVAGLLQPSAVSAPPLDIAQVGKVFHSGLIRRDHLNEVVNAATAEVTRAAQQLGSHARADFQKFLLGLAIMAALSVAVALATARSIVRPLQRLADRASEVSGGVIDGEPLTVGGPVEVAVVSEAFNETVANLRAVGAAALALSVADFDSPFGASGLVALVFGLALRPGHGALGNLGVVLGVDLVVLFVATPVGQNAVVLVPAASLRSCSGRSGGSASPGCCGRRVGASNRRLLLSWRLRPSPGVELQSLPGPDGSSFAQASTATAGF